MKEVTKQKTSPNPQLVLKRLARVFTAQGAMDLGDPFLTLIGVVLSARTRDEQVLIAMPELVRKFPTVHHLALAEISEIRACIATIGMNGQKARHLKGLAEKIVQEFDGKVPRTMEELITLPGVGRKTASVVLSAVFDTPAVAVDVHVHRIANRLGWSGARMPVGTEKDLLALVPRRMHSTVNRVFVKLGRYICLPRNPRCDMCPLQDICPYSKKSIGLSAEPDVLETDWRRHELRLQELRQKVLETWKKALDHDK